MSTHQVWMLLVVITVIWTVINLVVSLSIRRTVNARSDELLKLVKGAIRTNQQRAEIQDLQRQSIETRLGIIEMRLMTLTPAPDLESFAEDADDY